MGHLVNSFLLYIYILIHNAIFHEHISYLPLYIFTLYIQYIFMYIHVRTHKKAVFSDCYFLS